eukprot:SAG25_NODE_12740_length_276_cov_0.559322_1_plen_91_part_11
MWQFYGRGGVKHLLHLAYSPSFNNDQARRERAKATAMEKRNFAHRARRERAEAAAERERVEQERQNLERAEAVLIRELGMWQSYGRGEIEP